MIVMLNEEWLDEDVLLGCHEQVLNMFKMYYQEVGERER